MYVCMYIGTIYRHVFFSPSLLLFYTLSKVTPTRHLALLFKGLHGIKHFIVEQKHIITPTKLLPRPGVVSVTIYIHMLYSCMLTLKYLYIYMLYLCFTLASPLLIYATAVILLYLHLFIYTLAILVLYSYFAWCVCVCVCLPAYWPGRVRGAK